MKKLNICLVTLSFLSPFVLLSQPSKYLKLGVNYSSFRREEGKSEPGVTIGFGKNYYPIQNFSGFWGFDLSYTQEKILLEDKTWPSGSFPPYSGVVIGSFEISLSYLDFSLYLGYLLNVTKMLDLEFFVGPSLSMPVGKNIKETGSKTLFLDPEELSDYEFDFYFYDPDPGEPLIPFMERGMNFNTSMIAGTKLHWRYIHLTLGYSRAFNRTEGILTVTLFDKIDNISISVGIDF